MLWPAVALLDTFRVSGRGPQACGDIVRKMIAADTQHRAMSYRAIMKNRDIRSAAADIHQCHSQLALLRSAPLPPPLTASK